MPDRDDEWVLAWLQAIRDDGSDLEPAPAMAFSVHFDERRGQRRACHVCAYRRAGPSFIVRTLSGSRWADVCWDDYERVRRVNESGLA